MGWGRGSLQSCVLVSWTCPTGRLIAIIILIRLLIALLLLPLTSNTPVGLFAIEVGEDQVKHLRVPVCRAAFDAFFDVL